MTRLGYGLIGAAAVALVLAAALVPRGVRQERASPPVEAAAEKPAQPSPPTLYCEFTNFADRNPRVGFYFAIEEGRQPPVYAQIFQRDRDGTQDEFGGEGAPRPEWAFDGAENPAVIRSPDDAIRINLYDYDPKKAGTTWFEAGLRSIRYLNLGGKCRRSAA